MENPLIDAIQNIDEDEWREECINDDKEFAFDDDWITEYLSDGIDTCLHEIRREQEQEDETNKQQINAYFLYVEKDPGTLVTINTNRIALVKQHVISYDKVITKTKIIELIKDFQQHNDINYTLFYILKYQNTFTSEELERFIVENEEHIGDDGNNMNDRSDFLTVYKTIDDIIIDEVDIDILSRLKSLYFIFMKPPANEKISVMPPLKIPYTQVKSLRQTRGKMTHRCVRNVKPSRKHRVN